MKASGIDNIDADWRGPLPCRRGALRDHFEVREVLGAGGSGSVCLAEQRRTGHLVALKLLHPHHELLVAHAEREQSVARFGNEARAAARVQHPNSVSVIDYGRTDDGQMYIAMEYLPGRTLHRIVLEDGALPIVRACELVQGVLAAVAHAHACGVEHGDLSSKNVVAVGDRAVVVDYEYAHPIAPESVRRDLQSVGMVLFELLTGQRPEPVGTILQMRWPDPRDVAPERGITPALAAVTARALGPTGLVQRRAPEDFYETADAMADALRSALRP
jgi:serine/threonine-protein kinase